MGGAVEFSPQLIDWAAAGGLQYNRVTDDRRRWPHFVNGGGEELHFIEARPDGWFVLHHALRIDDAPRITLAARYYGVLERYLFAIFGARIRSRSMLPALALPVEPGRAAPGFRVAAADFDGVPSRGLYDTRELLAVAGADSQLVSLSAHLLPPHEQIRASYRSADGRPLFAVGAQRPAPPPGVSRADADALIELIRTDIYVNGEIDDVIVHRRSDIRLSEIRRVPDFYGYLYFFYVGEGYTSSSGFRYPAPSEADRRPLPMSVCDDTQEQIEEILARLRDQLPPERQWNAAVIAYKRAAGQGTVVFFDGDDAERWEMTPDNAGRIAETGRGYVDRI